VVDRISVSVSVLATETGKLKRSFGHGFGFGEMRCSEFRFDRISSGFGAM